MNMAARATGTAAELLAADGPVMPAAASLHGLVRFQLITDRAEFDALEADWNDLFAHAAAPTHVFQSFNFCWHWANHYLNPRAGGAAELRLCVVTARRAGRLILVLPLVTRRSRGLTRTLWLGDPVAQYGDAVIVKEADSGEVLGAAFAFLKTAVRADVLWLRHVREDANIAPLMRRLRANAVERRQAPFMDLSAAKDFSLFEQRYSGKARKNRRRLARRLHEKGDVAFVRFKGGVDARELAIEAVALKERWLSDRGMYSSAFGDQRMARLFADLAHGATRPVPCIVSAIKSKGVTAAVEVSFTCKGRLAMHLIAFDLRFEKSGAGVLLLEQGLRDGFAEQLDVYDMLAPADPYKLDWCDRTDDVVDWAHPLSSRGLLYTRVYLGHGRKAGKQLLKILPRRVRRLLHSELLLQARR